MALLGDAPADLGEEDSLPVPFRIDRKRPVADQVYDALKAAIVSVTLPPGSSISENRICRHFGVSRTPVRAAIIRLAALFAEITAGGAGAKAGLLAAFQIYFKQIGQALRQPPPVFSAQVIQ